MTFVQLVVLIVILMVGAHVARDVDGQKSSQLGEMSVTTQAKEEPQHRGEVDPIERLTPPSRTASPVKVVDAPQTSKNASPRTANATGSSPPDVRQILRTSRRERVQSFRTCVRQRLHVADNDDDPFTMYTVADDKTAPYEKARTTWNKAKQHVQYPDVVSFPETTDMVAAIVQCAKSLEYYVCARNGKHSYESDTCTYGIVVDLDRFNSFQLLSRKRGNVRLGAGQHLGHVALVLNEEGLVMPMGSCASVGLTGLALVGGHGMLARHHGLLVDFVSAVELVNAEGQVLYANATNEYSDYFWMARGGGAGVIHYPGVITALEFTNLPRAESTESVYTSFEFSYEEATVENAVKLLEAWQDFYLDEAVQADPLARRLMLEPWMRLDRLEDDKYDKVLRMAVFFYGDTQMHKVFMKKYLPRLQAFLPSGRISNVKRYDLLAFARMLAGVKNNEQLGDGKHGWDLKEGAKHRMNRWKGVSAVATDKVSTSAFELVAETIFESKPLSRRYVEFKALGGAMGDVGRDETAFWHRESHWWCLSNHFFRSTDAPDRVDGIYRNARERNLAFVDAMGSAFGGYYAGYIDRTNSTAIDLRQYYGDHAERLSSIKRQRDPDNVFRVFRPKSVAEIFQANGVLDNVV